MSVLHPLVMETLVRDRHAELRRAAQRARLHRIARSVPRPTVRRRVGWMLVEAGLRLAVDRRAVTG